MTAWTSRRRLVTIGFIAGAVAGLAIWSVQMRRSRRALFSASPVRRLAALGHLAGQPSVSTARLLADYVRWEQRPMLRKRAQQVLSRMQRHLA